MTTSDQTAAHHQALRDWARGSLTLEAATELLIRATDGHVAAQGQQWVHIEDNGHTWIDYPALTESARRGPWSGGEQRILALVGSIGDDAGLLSETLPGLDRGLLDLVLAAVAHAGGSHEHSLPPILWRYDDDGGEPHPYRNPDRAPLGSLHPWPATSDTPEGTR